MTKKFVENEVLKHPSRYNENKVEAWDFTTFSLFPHTIGTVVEYVIRYKHKGGIQDLEKAKRWLKKAKQSYKYLALCAPKLSVSEYHDLVPEVNEENFSDLSTEQLGILRTAQTLTMSLDNKHIFHECIGIIDKYLDLNVSSVKFFMSIVVSK